MADNRIFVIDEVQEMNGQAITALLKPLEEPPSDTFIIFCTTDPERLPATIRSRGVTYYFNQVPDDKLTQLVVDTVEREGHDPWMTRRYRQSLWRATVRHETRSRSYSEY